MELLRLPVKVKWHLMKELAQHFPGDAAAGDQLAQRGAPFAQGLGDRGARQVRPDGLQIDPAVHLQSTVPDVPHVAMFERDWDGGASTA